MAEGSGIVLTVALPLYRAKHSAWIALESLCRQKGTAEPWELLVAEEDDEEALGQQGLEKYRARLKQAGCERITRMGLHEWVALSFKWRILADYADEYSIGMVLQAADCWSAPGRLAETARLFEAGADWVHSKTHVLYDLRSSTLVTYGMDDYLNPHPCGAEMAARTTLMRQLPVSGVRRGVDGWIYKNMEIMNGGPLKVLLDDTENWRQAVNIHGLNNISNRHNVFSGAWADIFKPADFTIYDIIPTELWKRLEQAAGYASGRELIA